MTTESKDLDERIKNIEMTLDGLNPDAMAEKFAKQAMEKMRKEFPFEDLEKAMRESMTNVVNWAEQEAKRLNQILGPLQGVATRLNALQTELVTVAPLMRDSTTVLAMNQQCQALIGALIRWVGKPPPAVPVAPADDGSGIPAAPLHSADPNAPVLPAQTVPVSQAPDQAVPAVPPPPTPSAPPSNGAVPSGPDVDAAREALARVGLQADIVAPKYPTSGQGGSGQQSG